MHRFLVDTAQLALAAPLLPAAAAAHLKVVRPKDGEEVELFDGKGAWRRFVVAHSPARRGFDLSPCSGIARAPRARRKLILFACVTKGSRWDWTIEKATELGVTQIVPVLSERTIVRVAPAERDAKRARWMRVAEDAARQSDAKWLPEIAGPVPFADALARARETTCFAGALVTPAPPPILAAVMARGDAQALSLFVGPEGDFTREELSALLETAVPVSLGASVLRAETAAIYGVAVLRAWLDRAE